MKYSIGEVLKYSFKKVFEHLGTFIMSFFLTIGTALGGLLILLIGAVLVLLTPLAGPLMAPLMKIVLTILVGIVIWWYWGMIKAGYTRIALAICDTNSSWATLLFAERKLAWRMTGAWFLYRMIVSIGYLFFIIPGIYLEAKFAFLPYVLVDQKTGIIEAFKRSSYYSKNIVLDLMIFTIIFYCFALLSCLTLGISLFITYPASLIAFAYLYRSQRETINHYRS